MGVKVGVWGWSKGMYVYSIISKYSEDIMFCIFYKILLLKVLYFFNYYSKICVYFKYMPQAVINKHAYLYKNSQDICVRATFLFKCTQPYIPFVKGWDLGIWFKLSGGHCIKHNFIGDTTYLQNKASLELQISSYKFYGV